MYPVERYKENIRRNFNKASSTYDQYGRIQKIIGEKLITFLFKYKIHANQIIDLGCGSGLITQQLAEAMPYKSFHAVDIARDLLVIAKQRLQGHQIEIYEQDFDHLDDNNALFDLIFSNMALHWSLMFKKTLLKIHKKLVKNGLFAFSIPLEGTFLELNKNSVNYFHSENTILELLSRMGFKQVHFKTDSIVENFDHFTDALNSIKKIGANTITAPAYLTLRGKAFIKKMINPESRDVHPFSLTYRIGYFIAKKV
jgi:malonyl-CoA O-methyltransferase